LDRLGLRLARPTEILTRQRRQLALLAQRWGQALPKLQAMQTQRLNNLEQRCRHAVPAALRAQGMRLESLQARLSALDPQRVLARGYAWLDDGQGRALTSVAQLSAGQKVHAVLADGEAQMQVLAIEGSQTSPHKSKGTRTRPSAKT
jgi:exodeoxyribonuclease VII large subunit